MILTRPCSLTYWCDGAVLSIINVSPWCVCVGAVQPLGEPLRSQFQEGSMGVVQKLMLREHKLVWNSLSRTW